jgi:hypothetical protein
LSFAGAAGRKARPAAAAASPDVNSRRVAIAHPSL